MCVRMYELFILHNTCNYHFFFGDWGGGGFFNALSSLCNTRQSALLAASMSNSSSILYLWQAITHSIINNMHPCLSKC